MNGIYRKSAGGIRYTCDGDTPVSANISEGTVSALATGTTLTSADHFGKVITNTGASGAVTHTLPAASTVKGQVIAFTVLVAQIVNISPASTDGVFLNGSGTDNKDLILAGTIGTTAVIGSNGSDYYVISHTSGVTKEA